MPAAKLRFMALASDTCRLAAIAVRRSVPVLLLPFILEVLLQLAASNLPEGTRPYSSANLMLVAEGIIVQWMMLLVVARACLGGRMGLDLLRPDRPALRLLGLLAAYTLITIALPGVIPIPSGVLSRGLLVALTAVCALLLCRAMLLLATAWALGGSMTPAASWQGLRGNFLRMWFFAMVWIVLAGMVLSAIAYSLHAAFGYSRMFGITGWGLLGGFFDVMSTAYSCAVYRQLVIGPAPVAAATGLDAVAA